MRKLIMRKRVMGTCAKSVGLKFYKKLATYRFMTPVLVVNVLVLAKLNKYPYHFVRSVREGPKELTPVPTNKLVPCPQQKPHSHYGSRAFIFLRKII